jgi:hypothetical protein
MQIKWIALAGTLPVLLLAACGSAPVAMSETHAAKPRAAQQRSGDMPVPSSCSPDVNAKLASLVANPPDRAVDNVMVCGMTISSSRTRRGGRHGSHDLLPLSAPFPDGTTKLVEVVINEDLDGRITAPAHVPVFAYGQAYFDNTGHFVAGIHDVHCSTHAGADNGWVVVDGTKSPANCPSRY